MAKLEHRTWCHSTEVSERGILQKKLEENSVMGPSPRKSGAWAAAQSSSRSSLTSRIQNGSSYIAASSLSENVPG